VSAVQEAAADLAARVGSRERLDLGRVSARDARRFAVASGDSNPVYHDAVAAAEDGYEALAVPPLLLPATRQWGPGPDAAGLRPDGLARDDVGLPGVGGLRTVGGGQALLFHANVCVDVPIVAELTLRDVAVKHGRSGELLIVAIDRSYRQADGTPLLECRETRVLR
jgi:hydroxyacyl-ACP dehydratase HTD2-like protein with hotdog domain